MKRILLFVCSILATPLWAENTATQGGITVRVTEYLPDDVVVHKAIGHAKLFGKKFIAKGMKPLCIHIENTSSQRLMIDTRSIVARGHMKSTDILSKFYSNPRWPLLWGSLIMGAEFFYGLMPAYRAVHSGFATLANKDTQLIHIFALLGIAYFTLLWWAVRLDYTNNIASMLAPVMPEVSTITIAPGFAYDIVALCDAKQFDGKLTLRIFDAKDMYFMTHIGGQGAEDGMIMKCNLTL